MKRLIELTPEPGATEDDAKGDTARSLDSLVAQVCELIRDKDGKSPSKKLIEDELEVEAATAIVERLMPQGDTAGNSNKAPS